MDSMMTPEILKFNTCDQWAMWLLGQPKEPSEPGRVLIFQLKDVDRTFIKIGDGRTAWIDLPNIS